MTLNGTLLGASGLNQRNGGEREGWAVAEKSDLHKRLRDLPRKNATQIRTRARRFVSDRSNRRSSDDPPRARRAGTECSSKISDVREY